MKHFQTNFSCLVETVICVRQFSGQGDKFGFCVASLFLKEKFNESSKFGKAYGQAAQLHVNATEGFGFLPQAHRR